MLLLLFGILKSESKIPKRMFTKYCYEFWRPPNDVGITHCNKKVYLNINSPCANFKSHELQLQVRTHVNSKIEQRPVNIYVF